MVDNRLSFRRTLLNEDGEHVRAPQVALAERTEDAMRIHASGVFQAPTGIGKTRAMLYAGVAHILNSPGLHKSLYVAKTLPQLEHVFCEVEKYVIPACEEHGLGSTIHFGIALGTKPMIDRICSSYWEKSGAGGGNVACDKSCELYNQRNKPAIKTGPATLRHYKIAIESGRCPYAYMRDSLRESNFIIGTHAHVNHDYWLSRTFGSIDNLSNVSVIIDEAHNYVEELIQKAIIEISWDNQSQFSKYRQPESKISIPDMFGKFSEEITKLICWHNYKNTIKDITCVDSIDFREMWAQLNTELSAAYLQFYRNKDIQQKVMDIESAWKNNEPLEQKKKKQLIHMIDFPSNEFGKLIQEYEQVLQEIKAKLPRRAKLKNQKFEKIEIIKKAKQNWKRYKDVFDDAKGRGKLNTEIIESQNTAFGEMKDVIDDIQPQINSLNEKIQNIQDSLNDLFARKKKLFECIRSYQDNIFKLTNLSYNRIVELKNLKNEIKRYLDCLQNHLNNLKIPEEITEPVSLCLYNSSVIIATALKNTPMFFRSLAHGMTSGEGKSFTCLTNEQLRNEISNAVYELKSISKAFDGDYIEWLSDIKQLLLVLYEMTVEPQRFYVDKKSISNESVDISALQINDLDIGGKSERFLGRFYNTILTSATISPAKKTAIMLNWNDALHEELSPVFPRENYCVHGFLGFHAGKTYSADDSENRVSNAQLEYLKKHLPNIIKKTKGNVGCFVCSESFLKEIYPVLTQEVDWGDNVKHLLLSNTHRNMEDDYCELAAEHGLPLSKSLDFDGEWKDILKENSKAKIIVWFATTGKFSEGVDFPGKELTSAILIGIPYPNTQEIKSMLDRRIEYYRQYKSKSLADLIKEISYHIYPHRKLCQAVGRIHRRYNDRGAIIFLDERLFGLRSQRDSQGDIRIILDKSIDHTSDRYKILPQRIREQIVLIDSTSGNIQYNKKRLNDRFPHMLIGCMEDFNENIKLFYKNEDYKDDLRNRLKNFRLTNINSSVTREMMLQTLSQHYNVVSLVMPMNGQRNKGFAFVTVSTEIDECELLESLNEIRFNNRPIQAYFNML